MGAALSAYDRALARRPVLVKTATSGVLFATGDLLSQALEDKGKLDLERLGRLAAWGMMFAPLAHVWYGRLDKLVPGSSGRDVAKKVLADQAVFTPLINTGFFFATSMMESGDPEKAVGQVVSKLFPTLQVNWIVWPVLQTINFRFVPLQYRILFINGCVVFWSAFLSSMASGDTAGGDDEHGDAARA